MQLQAGSSYSGPFWTTSTSFSLSTHTYTCVYSCTRVYVFVTMCTETVTGAGRDVILKELGWKRKTTGKLKDSIKINSGFIYFITVPLLTTRWSGVVSQWCDSYPSIQPVVRYLSCVSQAVDKQDSWHALEKCAGDRLNNAAYLTTLSASKVNTVERNGEWWKINWTASERKISYNSGDLPEIVLAILLGYDAALLDKWRPTFLDY